jgi:SAM-dependent methyltransferase
MSSFWETLFREQGTLWGFHPADSAKVAIELFKHHQFSKILIPGSGYGRNAKAFLDEGFTVEGIELSETAIDIGRENHLNYVVKNDSLLNMHAINCSYDAIFCYATLHLFNSDERKQIIQESYRCLNKGGLMIFVVASKTYQLYGVGNQIAEDTFQLAEGLTMHYYNSDSLREEFSEYKHMKIGSINENIYYEEGHDPIPCLMAVVQKL